MTEQQLHDIPRHAESDAFSDREKRVLDYAAALTVTPATPTDAQIQQLLEIFDEEQLVELTAMIAWENFRARFNRGFDIAGQGFSEGAYCVLPEEHAARG